MRNQDVFRTPDDYFAMQPLQIRKKLEQLRSFILTEVPGAEEKINYNILAYALVKGGKRDQQIMIAGYHTHIGFYPTPGVLEKFNNELSAYNCGKGSVQFPLDKPLPEVLIRRMVRYRMEQITNPL